MRCDGGGGEMAGNLGCAMDVEMVGSMDQKDGKTFVSLKMIFIFIYFHL